MEAHAPPFDPLQPPPLVSADLPGIGGVIKQAPEDFEVEEIPAYEPCGQGDFLFLWVEKRDMGAAYFTRQLASRLGILVKEIGVAGLKDRHAVTRQWVSVPAGVEDQLAQLSGDGIQLLQTGRHTNKLHTGHLRGNRFRILVRQTQPNAGELLEPLVERLRGLGLPNFYGPQRFGRGGETFQLGWSLLRGDKKIRNPFLRKLALSAVQSALFNVYLARRMEDGQFRTVLAGDVMSKRATGGMFTVEDQPAEQARFDVRETVHAGPIFGRKMFPAGDEAADRERAVLTAAGLAPDAFTGFGKLLLGTRRHNLVYPDDLRAEAELGGVRLTFTLPAGSYATVLLRELTKSSLAEAEDET